MITDDGFLFLLGLTTPDEALNYVKLGTTKEDITSLNPPTSITNIQSSVSTSFPDQAGVYKLALVDSYSPYIESYNSSLKIIHPMGVGTTSGVSSAVSRYYEIGLFSNKNKLLAYQVLTNISKTFLVHRTLSSTYKYAYNFSMVVPLGTKTSLQTLSNRGISTAYKVKIKLLDRIPDSSFSLLKGLKVAVDIVTPSTINSIGVTLPRVELGSYDNPTKTVTYNLIIDANTNVANKPTTSELLLKTSFGFFSITFNDATTDANLGIPLADVGSLVIPLTFNLGEIM